MKWFAEMESFDKAIIVLVFILWGLPTLSVTLLLALVILLHHGVSH